MFINSKVWSLRDVEKDSDGNITKINHQRGHIGTVPQWSMVTPAFILEKSWWKGVEHGIGTKLVKAAAFPPQKFNAMAAAGINTGSDDAMDILNLGNIQVVKNDTLQPVQMAGDGIVGGEGGGGGCGIDALSEDQMAHLAPSSLTRQATAVTVE